MNSPKVKICGISNIEILKTLISLDLDFIGFIFYSKSPSKTSENVYTTGFLGKIMEAWCCIRSLQKKKAKQNLRKCIHHGEF